MKRKTRYSIFSRREDGSLALGLPTSDDARPPAPPGRPYRNGLLLMVTLLVLVLAVPKIFHIGISLSSPIPPKGVPKVRVSCRYHSIGMHGLAWD